MTCPPAHLSTPRVKKKAEGKKMRKKGRYHWLAKRSILLTLSPDPFFFLSFLLNQLQRFHPCKHDRKQNMRSLESVSPVNTQKHVKRQVLLHMIFFLLFFYLINSNIYRNRDSKLLRRTPNFFFSLSIFSRSAGWKWNPDSAGLTTALADIRSCNRSCVKYWRREKHCAQPRCCRVSADPTGPRPSCDIRRNSDDQQETNSREMSLDNVGQWGQYAETSLKVFLLFSVALQDTRCSLPLFHSSIFS